MAGSEGLLDEYVAEAKIAAAKVRYSCVSTGYHSIFFGLNRELVRLADLAHREGAGEMRQHIGNVLGRCRDLINASNQMLAELAEYDAAEAEDALRKGKQA